jgi:hypothetical protein
MTINDEPHWGKIGLTTAVEKWSRDKDGVRGGTNVPEAFLI